MLSKFVGESERGVREIFHKAKQAAPASSSSTKSMCVVPSRGGGSSDSHVTERVIGQFLAEMDGIEELKSVLILGATNLRRHSDRTVASRGCSTFWLIFRCLTGMRELRSSRSDCAADLWPRES